MSFSRFKSDLPRLLECGNFLRLSQCALTGALFQGCFMVVVEAGGWGGVRYNPVHSCFQTFFLQVLYVHSTNISYLPTICQGELNAKLIAGNTLT